MKNKKEKERIQNQSKKPTIGTYVVKSEFDDALLVTTISLTTTSRKGVGNDWVLDSGRTYHMCPHRD